VDHVDNEPRENLSNLLRIMARYGRLLSMGKPSSLQVIIYLKIYAPLPYKGLY
jgi:hypothetical protein